MAHMKLHDPLVSTIIPTYMRPNSLRRAIESALNQEGVNLKICVYDNASSDNTADVVSNLSKADPRINYLRHERNVGGGANFRFGMERVDTPFFSFLSDDDYLLPGFYQRAVAALQHNPAAMCWIGMTLNVDENDAVWDARVLRWPRDGLFSPPEGFFHMTGGTAPTWTGILFRREVIERIGLLDLSMLGPADLEYLLRLATRVPFLLDKHPSAVFTLNSTSFSATQPLSSFWPGWKRMLKKLEDDGDLDAGFKQKAIDALNQDACKMLFRRGANALAARRLDFARDAAEALSADCGRKVDAGILRTISAICEHSAAAQTLFTWAYRKAEQRIVRSRAGLQQEYGHLLRPI